MRKLVVPVKLYSLPDTTVKEGKLGKKLEAVELRPYGRGKLFVSIAVVVLDYVIQSLSRYLTTNWNHAQKAREIIKS